MRLRTHTRAPGRYREEEDEDLPPNPIFVVPTIAFNPNRRPAVFPTLEWNETLEDRAKKDKEREDQREPEKRRAAIFRDTRTVPIMEQTDDVVQMPDGRWVSTLGEPGEFDPYAVGFSDDEDEDQPQERSVPAVFSQTKYWSDLSEGMRLVVIRELTDHMDFDDAVSFLQIGDQEFDDFINLCVDEVNIQEESQARDARIQERQMALRDSGIEDDDAFGRIVDEEMARGDVKMSAVWKFSREDVFMAKSFLGNYRFREEFEDAPDVDIEELDRVPPFAVLSTIQNRLELYIGVEGNYQIMDLGIDLEAYMRRDVEAEDDIEEDAEEDIEEQQDLDESSAIKKQVENPSVLAPAQNGSRPVNPPSGLFKRTNTSTKSAEKASPKKDIERDGIENELIRKRGRPRKSDKIIRGPSQLREVTNAADIKTPNYPPKDEKSDAINSSINPAPHGPSISVPRSLQNLARSPFKEFFSTSSPPKHFASFRNDLPAQPALTSPPKGSSRGDELTTVAQNALGIQLSPVVKDITKGREVQDAQLTQAAPSAQESQILQAPSSVEATPNIQPEPNHRLSQQIDALTLPGPSAPPDLPAGAKPPVFQSTIKYEDPNLYSPLHDSGIPSNRISPTPAAVQSIGGKQSQSAEGQIQPARTVTQPNPPKAANVAELRTPTRNLDFIQYTPNNTGKSSASPSKPASTTTSVLGGEEEEEIRNGSPNFRTPTRKLEFNSTFSAGSKNSVEPQTPNPYIQSALDVSERTNVAIEPQTPTYASKHHPNPPKRPSKRSLPTAESKAASQTLVQETAEDEAKRLGAPPPIMEEKTRSAAKRARTISQSSTGSLDPLQNNSPVSVKDSHAPHKQQSPGPTKTKVEVQISGQKRSASELPVGTFESLGSSAKKLKSDAALSSFCRIDANNRPIPAKRDKQKIPGTQQLTAASQGGNRAAVRGSGSMHDPPAQVKGIKQTGAAKKNAGQPKATLKLPAGSEDAESVPRSSAEPSIQDPQPPVKGGKKSKVPQPTNGPQPKRATKAPAPKANPTKTTALKASASKASAGKSKVTKGQKKTKDKIEEDAAEN